MPGLAGCPVEEIGLLQGTPAPLKIVMPGLVPGIHVGTSHCRRRKKQLGRVDGRDKPGHDGRSAFRLARVINVLFLF